MSKADELIQLVMGKRDRAAKKIGLFTEGQAKNNSPVDTGTLKRSIMNEVQSDEQKSVVEVGSNLEYAYFVHNGTSRQKAQPFLTDAVEQNLEQIKQIIENEMKLS